MTDHTVRAAGADRSFQEFILGKFPGMIPNLRGPGPWRLSRNEQDNAKEWTLQGGDEDEDEEETDTNTTSKVEKYRGVPDAGITGSSTPSNYFILIKEKGVEGLIAIPVDQWATFKSIQRRSQLSLDDAEAQMKFRRLQAARANPSIAQAIGDEDAEAGGPAAGPAGPAAAAAADADNEPDSDDEWKDIKARAASLATMKQNNTATRRPANATEDNDAVNDAEALGVSGAVYVPKPVDAEDWEHEGEAADDDLDMEGSDAEVELSPGRAPKSNEGSDSDGDGEGGIDAMKKAIRRMMKGTGKGGSDESEDVSEIEEDEDEGDLDDLDALDRMASEVLPKAGGDGGGGKKRKSPPPADGATITGYTPVSRAVEDAEIEATAAKKARIAAAVPSPPISPTAVSGPPTEEEVTAFIQARGRMLLKDLSQAFTARLKTKEEKQNFSGLIKKVVKLVTGDDGKKYVVLKKTTT